MEKIEDGLTVVLIALFNRSSMEHAVKNGLFEKLMNLFYNVKQMGNGQAQQRALLAIGGGFTFCQ